MYTQCSKCETVFKLSAQVLRAAGGQVRCGKCGEVFNALARLAEDSSAFEGGESVLDLEARAESILESVAVPPPAAAPSDEDEFAAAGVQIAHLKFTDLHDDEGERPAAAAPEPQPEFDDDRSMEFTLPPGELDRIFIESKAQAKKDAQPAVPEITEEAQPAPHPESIAEPAAVPDRRVRPIIGMEVSEDVQREVQEGLYEDARAPHTLLKSERRVAERRHADASPAGRRVSFLWLGAAIGAALLLIFQVASHERATNPRSLFSSLGSSAPAPASLSTYQLRQWGVTGDPNANGTLRVRASILNTAAQLEPYPLLRVTLANRFGSRIGVRDFEPSEYLGTAPARLLAPGERADATLDILDPGKSAEGFEIDVCLRRSDGKISCASDVASQTRK